MADTPETTEAPVTEAPKVTLTKNPIMAHIEQEDGSLTVASGPFNEYVEFKAWVKDNGAGGITFIPMRVVGKPLTVQTVNKTTLV